ncbi:PAB-dependent poly(A)-specific ribonuclease subunit PAN3 [Emericellopsis atlantica]|uniref:PAN2-PAN3 deadenylation complex subunit PAN3 n=1 Tax=Emericellopsis atlantica TaxID=2614577 RepID=A0A9P8CNT3_9HYPO|nr:PAB-dependent poly(A)-specific ribonuclease subunit PAN3 [Emericellopsis atlantica]KAG9254114.1 PAB-dependent poly(A)-specific ribonuclease subunit PAN3 [Emericellopsis atlantica]
MATTRYQNNDVRRQVGSPRPKGRVENKDTLCRNVLIYGHCRYEDQGCAFSHDQNKNKSSPSDLSKKALNVDSPTFTPATTASKKATLSTQAANAPSFTPRGFGAAAQTDSSDASVPSFNPAAIREFTPSFDVANNATPSNGTTAHEAAVAFDPFSMQAVGQSLPTTPFNPYADDQAALGAGAGFFPSQNAYQTPLQPLQHHLYSTWGPKPTNLKPYERTTSDFFIPEDVRIDLTKKNEAANQVMPNSQLPQLDNYHSLVPLDTTHRKNASIFGYNSWVYKAKATRTGTVVCLRRLQDFRLSNEHAIRSVKEWRRIVSANVVQTHDAFTTRMFGDSSLVFVQDFHPLSQTLAEAHLATSSHGGRFAQKNPIQESVLWSYITQIATALKAIHGKDLAARCIDVTKIILTDARANRIRLGACSILDVVHYEARRPVAELQQEDFINFGRVILSLATNTHPSNLNNINGSIEQLSRVYSVELRDTVLWLLSPQQPPAQKGIEEFMRGIALHAFAQLDVEEQGRDADKSHLSTALENGRQFRLMLKLAAINERHELNGDPNWSENGERYLLKLFRDYCFHQVDADGNPVLDVYHMITCLGKLEAGSEEKVCLTSRDEQTSFVVSYKELKKQLGSAFGDLQKASKQAKGL